MTTSFTAEHNDQGRAWLLTYGVAITLGAFLLFEVEPLVAKYILPWFGGSTEVWTTCLLFFQVMLLLGYLYAHLSSRFLSRRSQLILHGVVLLGAMAFLPVIPAEHWKPTDVNAPALRILALLTATAGLPFLAIAATSPLLQSWMSALRPQRDVYRLYAVSNGGSLLALVSYPILVEPNLSRHAQSWAWSAGLLALATLCVLCGTPVWELDRAPASASTPSPPTGPGRLGRTSKARPVKIGRPHAHVVKNPAHEDGPWSKIFWVLLPAAASMMLLASTNMICLEVASFPFLWVLPLTVYLLTFIFCFAGERWYPRATFVALTALSVLGVASLHFGWIARPSIALQIFTYMSALFTCCMVTHGETYRLRPAPEKLTAFYLSIAAGGALGGFLVAIVAPLVFRAYWELYIAMPLCLGLSLAAIRPTGPAGPLRFRRYRALGIMLAAGTGAFLLVTDSGAVRQEETLERTRNFYGVLRVLEATSRPRANMPKLVLKLRKLLNGPTNHGGQIYDVRMGEEAPHPPLPLDASTIPPAVVQARATPTTYYGPGTGGGIAMHFHSDGTMRPRSIGVVGLGVGTLALYGQVGDTIRFYEINPDVPIVADKYFTFLSDARRRGVNLEVKLGDGRLLLQKESSRSLDILVVDAFSGDAVPVHLLTREAFELYLDRLRDDGVLAIHASNRHLDLKWEILRIARFLNMPAALIHHTPSPREPTLLESKWVLVTRNTRLLDDPTVQPYLVDNPAELKKVSLWTDDFSSVLEVLEPQF